MTYGTEDLPHKWCLSQVLLVLICSLTTHQLRWWPRDMWGNRRKPDNKPGLEIAINYPKTITHNGSLGTDYHRTKVLYIWKNQM